MPDDLPAEPRRKVAAAPDPLPNPHEAFDDGTPIPEPDAFLETGYATSPQKRPSKNDQKHAWTIESSGRHERERQRIYSEAFALMLHRLKERRAEITDAGRLAENTWLAGWILEHGMIHGSERFDEEMRRLGVDPSMFLEDAPGQ
jgi:hypothetical protein